MVQTPDAENKLEILKNRTRIDLSLNEMRIIVGCFNALAYQGELDNETYLDSDALCLKSKVETLYQKLLKHEGKSVASR